MGKRRKKEWFDDEALWEAIFPFLFSEQRFAETPQQVEKALALTKPVGKAVLDLCCGPGRCSVALAEREFQVTAVDKSKHLLNKARAKARAAGVKVEWVHKDMRDFVRAGAFDLVLNMFTSFGYFEDKKEDMDVLRHILNSLRPGGVCLIEGMGKEILAKAFQPTGCQVLADETKLIERREVFDDWTRVRNEWILIRDGKTQSFTFCLTIYSGQELKDRMEAAGFRNVKLYGSLDGEPYGPEAKRLIAVGTKSDVTIR